MPSRPEGGLRLIAHNTNALFLSSLTVAAVLPANIAGAESRPQPSHLVEAKPVRPRHAIDIGKVATQNNFNFSIGIQPFETTTTMTNQPEASSFSLQISLDSVMKYIMTIASTGVPAVTPAVFARWNKTHKCEEREVYDSYHHLIGGGWHVNNPSPRGFSGGLGIENSNYLHYLTNPPNLPNLIQLGFPIDQSQATPLEQIIVAERIQPNAPEQDVCNGW